MADVGARTGRTWSLATVPGFVVSFLPCIACPGCWPAYAGALSALGLGALLDRAWLLPIAIVALALAVFGLAFRARQRRGYAPAVVGAIASAAVLVGKFALELEALTYVGAITLGGATLWNAWPRRSAATCDACTAECTRSAA